MRTTLGLLLLSASTLASAADGDAEARLAWQLSFGADHAATSGYSLALGYREHEAFQSQAPLLKLAELSLTDGTPAARLAGMPVATGRYGANQVEGDIAYSSSPIYWVWWVATGAVITVVAIDKANDDDAPAPIGSGSGGGP